MDEEQENQGLNISWPNASYRAPKGQNQDQWSMKIKNDSDDSADSSGSSYMLHNPAFQSEKASLLVANYMRVYPS